MRRVSLKIGVICVVSCLIFAGCDLDEEFERTVSVSLPVAAGQKLVVHADVGSIRLTGQDIQDGNVTAKITGKGNTVEKAQKVAESINIIVENEDNNVFVKIDKPPQIKSSWYSVDYIIEVPKNISLESKIDVGSIKVSDLKGDIIASTDVGSVICGNVRGKMNLETDVGDVDLTYDSNAESAVDATLSTDVGDIRLQGPANMSAEVDASTDVGSIRSDLPIVVKGKISTKKLHGTIGQGEGNIRLKTNVGSIVIR